MDNASLTIPIEQNFSLLAHSGTLKLHLLMG